MKTAAIKLFSAAAALLLWAALPGTAAVRSSVYEELSGEIAGYAKTNGIDKLVVAEFAAKAGAERFEAEYISEKISGYLGAGGPPELMDRDYLQNLLYEIRLSSAAAASAYREKLRGEILSVDAVVTGAVFAAGEKVRILLKLVDARKGKIMFSAEAEARRVWMEPAPERAPARDRAVAGGVFFLTPELPGILIQEMPLVASAPGRPSGFRDAVAEPPDNSCASRQLTIAGRNAALVDAKAAYWAAKMREPGLNGVPLGARPGSEITDPQVKARFYELLKSYYKGGRADRPDTGRLDEVLILMEDEARLARECAGQ